MTAAGLGTPVVVLIRGVLSPSPAELIAAVESDDEVMVLARLNVAGSALYALWLLFGVNGRDQVRSAGTDPELAAWSTRAEKPITAACT